MIKVAMHSVTSCAHDPGAVMRGLNRILSGQLRGQFVSAAYLWLDLENNRARYSAAGHPPLLRWHNDKLDHIESNGLLFGVMRDGDYPVRELEIANGDRFLLYTDGVTEPEDAAGNSFGENKMEEVLGSSRTLPASGVIDRLLFELEQWLPPATTQQDDITLLIIDVLKCASGEPDGPKQCLRHRLC
jgi:sigma-B regulation protein RsbU (phosphoserine phosphatase)